MPLPEDDNLRLVRSAHAGEPRARYALLRERQLPLYAYVAELTRDCEAARYKRAEVA